MVIAPVTTVGFIPSLSAYVSAQNLDSSGLYLCVCARVCVCSAMSDSLQRCGLKPASFLLPWDFPGNDTGLGCHFLLQRIFLTWGCLESLSSRDLLSLLSLLTPHWQAGSLPLCHLGSPDLYLPRKQKGDTPWSLGVGRSGWALAFSFYVTLSPL